MEGGKYMAQRFKPVCQFCGKVGGARAAGTSTGGTPNMTPTVSGKCPSSPTGKHAPRWEIA